MDVVRREVTGDENIDVAPWLLLLTLTEGTEHNVRPTLLLC